MARPCLVGELGAGAEMIGGGASSAGGAATAAGPVAAVDIGTNTLLMLVAAPTAAGLTAIRDECRFARLGQGLDRSGMLALAAIERSLAVLRFFRSVLDEVGTARMGAVGTQALREASNADEFLAPAREILGAPVEVISGEREAALILRATRESFPELATGPLVVADVGGGSTEIIVCDTGEVRSVKSVPIGSVRLSERCLRSDPPRKEETRSMIADIDAALAAVELPRGARFVATAGTATTMAAIAQRLDRYDPDRVHGYRMGSATVDRQLARLLELSVAERRRLPGLQPERADVIVAGAAIFARLMHRLDAGEMIVSDHGVRWGLAHELAADA